MNAAEFFPEKCELNRDRIILVTGGAGFIGSALVECLLGNGFKVRCLDNFSTGFRENIEPFYQYPGFEMLEGQMKLQKLNKEIVGAFVAEIVVHAKDRVEIKWKFRDES